MRYLLDRSKIDSVAVETCRFKFLDDGGKVLASMQANTLTYAEDAESIFLDDGRMQLTLTNAQEASLSINAAVIDMVIDACAGAGGGGGGSAVELHTVEYAIDSNDVSAESAVIVTPGLIPAADGGGAPSVVISFRGITLNLSDYNTFDYVTGEIEWSGAGIADAVPQVDDVFQIWWLA